MAWDRGRGVPQGNQEKGGSDRTASTSPRGGAGGGDSLGAVVAGGEGGILHLQSISSAPRLALPLECCYWFHLK